MTMSWSGLSKFVLGFALAIALLFLAGAGLTRYLLTHLSTPPPRPVFTNDPSPNPAASTANSTTSPASPTAAVNPANPASPSPSPSASPSPQGYQARVTQPIGLIVRQQPSIDAPRVGGVEFNSQVTVLEDNPDGSWQRIQANGIQGWVKGGNVQRVN